MSTKDLILAIDNGTQSLKALIFDPAGQLQAKEAVTFDPHFSEQPAWAEQHPEVFWKSLIQACQAIWNRHNVDKDRIAGVALTTQRGSVVTSIKTATPCALP
jgi:sugar (pentulose or hexulose) kinase